MYKKPSGENSMVSRVPIVAFVDMCLPLIKKKRLISAPAIMYLFTTHPKLAMVILHGIINWYLLSSGVPGRIDRTRITGTLSGYCTRSSCDRLDRDSKDVSFCILW